MQWSFLDLFPILLLALSLFGIQPVKPIRTFNEHYLSRETGNALRGSLALGIIMHHLAQKMQYGLLFSQFQYTGYLGVAVFFFLSGYGLMKSHMTRDTYKNHFLLRRIPKILLPYLLMTIVFWLFYSFNGNTYSVKALLLTTLNGSPIVPFSWYILCILCFYVFFWILMLLFKKHYSLMIAASFVWYVIYTAFCLKMNYGGWWYKTAFFLMIGQFWAVHEIRLFQIFKKYYRVLAPMLWIGFIVLFICFVWYTSRYSIRFISFALVFLYTFFFLLSTLAFSMKFQIGNKALSFLGNNSLEIYLVQGLFMEGLRSKLVYVHNDFIFAFCTLAGSVFLGSALHSLTHIITKKIKV